MSIATEIKRIQDAKTAIKNAIIDKGVTDISDDDRIDTYAEKIGLITGGGGGGDDDHYNTFWDIAQQNGARTDYGFGFSGKSWTDVTFKPKYDINVTNASNMFVETEITDLKGILDNLGLKLDFSKSTGFTYTFQRSKITYLGEINTTNTNQLQWIFHNSFNLISIDKLILKDSGNQAFDNMYSFGGCRSLTDIYEIEGAIGCDINFKDSPLSVNTMKNIINALENLYDLDLVGEFTLTFSSDCWNRLNASGIPDGYVNWQAYVEAVKGWST